MACVVAISQPLISPPRSAHQRSDGLMPRPAETIIDAITAEMEQPVRIDRCYNVKDFRLMARRRLPGPIFHYIDGAAVVIEVSDTNPVRCTPETRCSHTHGPGCGHEQVPHGDHIDYLVDGRLHHPHDGHCDDHGPVAFG
jgi:hypothetical protein